MDHLRTSARASARTMDELIIPALGESGDARAVEQAHLVRDLLAFVAERAHLVGPRIDLQLRQAADLAASVLSQAGERTGAACATLAGTLDEARNLPMLALRSPDACMELTDRLSAAVSAVVREVAAAGDPDATRAVRLAALGAIEARIETDRAWLAPLGFDPEPATISDLAGLLGIADPSTDPQPPASPEER
jgi:hypothetical protein